MSGSQGRFSSLETNPGGKPSGGKPQGVDRRDAAYYMRRGYLAEMAGDHDSALNHYSAALGENPLYVEAWVAQLWALIYLGEPVEAHVWADRALEAFPNQPDLMALKSMALLRCRLITEAREINDIAMANGRESANVWLARGGLQLTTNGQVAASACFKHALAASGDDKDMIYFRIGEICLYYKEFADAVAYLREAANRLPEAAWVWYNYGLALRAISHDDAPKTAFAKALRLVPHDSRYSAAMSKKKYGFFRRLMLKLRSN